MKVYIVFRNGKPWDIYSIQNKALAERYLEVNEDSDFTKKWEIKMCELKVI